MHGIICSLLTISVLGHLDLEEAAEGKEGQAWFSEDMFYVQLPLYHFSPVQSIILLQNDRCGTRVDNDSVHM